MTRFSVEAAALQDLAGRLRGLAEEFAGLGDVAEGYEEAVGSDEVAEQLRSFAGNWSDKRREITKLAHAVAGYAASAAEAYTGVDGELASRMQPRGGNGSNGSGAGPGPAGGR